MSRTTTSDPRLLFAQANRAIQDRRPELAAARLREILRAYPEEVNSLRLLGSLLLAEGKHAESVRHLDRAVTLAPAFSAARLDLARAYLQKGEPPRAVGILEPGLAGALGQSPEAWQLLADASAALGDMERARDAHRKAISVDPLKRQIGEAIRLLGRSQRREAENIFRGVLKEHPDHIHALVGLASIALDAGAAADAERLLRRSIAVSASLDAAWRGLARVLSSRADHEGALAAAHRALELAPDHADCWTMLGTVRAWSLSPAEARGAFRRSLEINPEQPRVLLSLGHVEKTLGNREAAEKAYREAIARKPAFGEAYWSLADLKTYRFRDAEVAAMGKALDVRQPEPSDRAGFEFALGTAREDQGRHDEAFRHFARGNAIKAGLEPFDLDGYRQTCAQLVSVVDGPFVESRRATSASAVRPVFVVGLPRSGSTLIEQILASHSAVQGTMELPHVLNYVRELERRGGYPTALADLTAADFADLGERYLRETALYRGGASVFLDKMPNNFLHIGLIRMMLPQAVIIDARRHPLDCCLSIFKQNFAHGQAFSYDLSVVGAYYRGYLELMAHWQRVTAESVLLVRHEALVGDPEGAIRRMLRHVDLPFEAQCLEFHKTRRPVRTASAEQVRQPLNRRGIGAWRPYAPHLAPLVNALGDAVGEYERSLERGD